MGFCSLGLGFDDFWYPYHRFGSLGSIFGTPITDLALSGLVLIMFDTLFKDLVLSAPFLVPHHKFGSLGLGFDYF